MDDLAPRTGAGCEPDGDSADADNAAVSGAGDLAEAAAPHSRGFLDMADSFEHSGNPADLDLAIIAGWRELGSVTTDSATRARRAGRLAILLFRRFELTGRLPDLDAAVDAARRGVALAPDASEEAGVLASLLGQLLAERVDQTGDYADLTAAVDAARKAVADTPKDRPGYPGFVSNLGDVLLRRYENAGERTDVDSAVDARHTVVALTARQDQPSFGFALGKLAEALHARFELTRNEADVRAAVEAAQDSVRSLGERSPEAAGCWSCLGATLRARFTVSRNPADLNQAVNAGCQAVELTAAGDPSLNGRLSHLAKSLLARFEFTGDRAGLLAAIDILRARSSSEDLDRQFRQRCTEVLAALDIPVPAVDLKYLKAKASETRRVRRQWFASLPVRLLTSSGRAALAYDRVYAFMQSSTREPSNARREVAAVHRQGIGMACVWACQDTPFVLYLRNFDSSDGTSTDPEIGHAVLYRHAVLIPGRSLSSRSSDDIQSKLLDSGFRMLEVANSHGELDLGRPGYRVYLERQTWREHVAALMALAEVIIMNAIHVSEGVAAELEMIRGADRVSDTIVIIPSRSAMGEYLEGQRLAETAAKVLGNKPNTRRRHRHQKQPSLESRVGRAEFFTANHPLLQGPYLKIVEYGRGLGADENLELIASLVQSRVRRDE